MQSNPKLLHAEHGVVCRMSQSPRGYFGWPSVARMPDGALVVVASGLREWHICPWGKTVLLISRDDGRTWSDPRVIRDSPIDDRDAGVLAVGERGLVVSLFSSDPRPFEFEQAADARMRAGWHAHLSQLRDGDVLPHAGSWLLLSDDGGDSWGAPIPAPVSSPHGPILLADGRLLYLGKDARDLSGAGIASAVSGDHGRTWSIVGEVPLPQGTTASNYHEPHVVELDDGRLIGLIRIENAPPVVDLEAAGFPHFGLMQTESFDGGRTWSTARPTIVRHGAPPHVFRHSSGALVCAYSHRRQPYGQRVMFSHDAGASWDADWVLRDDGPTWDLGYPASVELADGTIFSVYYQQFAMDEPCSLLWSRWKMPS
jgi:sialidase-1